MRVLLIGTALLVAASSSSLGQSPSAPHGISPDKMSWGPAPPSLPKGAQASVLAGNPGKSGHFTLRLKMPAGYKIPAHQHPTAELVTVLSGDLGVGMGDKLDEAKGEKLGPGGFVNLPANMNHFAFAPSEVIVQIDSDGPFAITYVDPKDDPRRTQ